MNTVRQCVIRDQLRRRKAARDIDVVISKTRVRHDVQVLISNSAAPRANTRAHVFGCVLLGHQISRSLCSVCYFFRLSRDPLAIATNIMPAAPSASVRIVSADIPTLSRAINPSNSAVATAAVSPRITSTHRFMW